jgi:transcriptional regulator with XRE-family HTH domain
MGILETEPETLDQQIARRLRVLRHERGWSLEDLAKRSGVSRATLSRLENADVSPTAQALGKLCSAYGLTLSRLMHLVEETFPPLVTRAAQPLWTDPETGFGRRMVSPPARALGGEVLEGTLGPGVELAYDAPPRPGLEHHLVLLEGALSLTIEGTEHHLVPGDCLRYQLFGASRFNTPKGKAARYLLFML